MLKGITYISASKIKKQNVPIVYRIVKEKSISAQKNLSVHDIKINRFSVQENKFVLFFLLGIILGTIFFNLFCRGEASQFGIYNEYFRYRFQDFDVNKKDLFLYAFFRYEKEILFVLVFSFTSLGMLVSRFFLLYKGAGIGILISVYVHQYGIGGIVLYVLSVFPQMITYVFLILVLVTLAEEVYRDRKEEKKFLLWKKKAVSYGKAFFILLVLNMVTSYLETYINLGMIQQVFL